MKPEEILYNTVLEIDSTYGIGLDEFVSNLYQNEGYLLALDKSIRGFNDETNKALDQIKTNFKSEGIQSEFITQDTVKKPEETTVNEKLTQLLPVGLFDVEGLDNEDKARTLTRYLNKVAPSLNAKYDNQFGGTKVDGKFVKGGYATIDVNGEKIDLSKGEAIDQQKQLVNILSNIEGLNLEELEANIAKDDAEFKSLTSYDKPDEVQFNIGEYKYKGNTTLPFVLSEKEQERISKELGNETRLNITTGKEELYNDLSIFDKIKVTETVQGAIEGASGSKRMEVEKYANDKFEDYLEQAKMILQERRKADGVVQKLEDGVSPLGILTGGEISEEEIRREALKLYEADLILEAKKQNFEKYIEGDIEGIKGLTDEQKKDLKLKASKTVSQQAAILERKNDVLNDYLAQIEAFKDPENSKYVSELNEFKNNSSVVYDIKPGEKYYQSEDGRKIPAWLYDAAKAETNRIIKLGEEARELILDINEGTKDLSDNKEKFNIIRKNYNDASKFGVMLGLATTDLITSTLYGAYKIAQYLNPVSLAMKITADNLGFDDPVDQGMMALKSWEENVRDDYKDDIAFGDINSLADVGQYTYQSIANQAPIIVSMIATGGLSGVAAKSAGLTGKALQTAANVSSSSMIGLSSFGGKMSDMNYEEFTTGKDLYSDTEVFLKSIGYGVAEGAFAYFSTAPLLNKGLGKVAGVSDDLLERELSEGFRQEISKHLRKDIMPETLGEMFFEGLTTGTQNLIDGRPFMENMKETIVSSGAWGLGMSGIPSLYVAGTKNFTANKELNIINKNTNLANQLRRKNASLIESINNGTVSDVAAVQADIDNNNSLIQTYEAKAVDAYLTAEENVREKGMLPDDATNFIEGQTNLYKIREEAYTVANDKTKSKAQIEQELEIIGEVYNQAAQGMERFNKTETFGSGYGALMMNAAGKDKNDVVRKKYTEITNQATQNLFDKNRTSSNPKDNYNPTGTEIANEADNILFEQQMDKQLEKDRKQSEKLGHTFIDFESKEQAIREITNTYDIAIELETNPESKASLEANKKGTIERINKGSLNGGSISGAGFELDFAVRENMTKNKRFTTGLHENTHTISRKLLKNNPEAFKNLGDQILKYLVYTNQTDALKSMNASNANLALDGEFDYDEVISSFVELIAEDKVDLNKMDNFKAAIGKLFNEGLMNASDGDYNIEFKGQKDILEFFLGFGKKLAAGEVELADLTEAQDRFSIVDKQGKVIPISDTKTQNKIAASKVKASETAKFSKADQDLFTKVNEVYRSDQSINNKALEIGSLYRNFVESRLNKGFRVGKTLIRPRDFDGFNNEVLEDVVSDMATGGSGVPGLVRAYANRDMKRFSSITLPQWINARLNQRILGYLPNDLITNDISIDSETAKQIEDAKAGKFTELDSDTKQEKAREIIPVEDLKIVTPELVDEVKDIITRTLKKTALVEGISNESVLADLNTAIEKEITKVIKSKMGPITRSVLGFAPKQYMDFIKDEMMTIVGSMPTNLIKQKAKSKAWAEVFKLEEIGREDIKKVNPDTGKVTNYRKQIFKLEKPDPQKFQRYFTRGGYTTLIERQRSLIKPMAQQLTRSELARLRQDKSFIEDLADRTGMTDLQVTELFVDNVIQDIESELDNTASEILQQDTVKFSETLANASSQDKQIFVSGLRSDSFKSILGQMLSNSEYFNKNGDTNALREAIITYFTGVKFDDLTSFDIKKIANDFGGIYKPTFQKQIADEMKKFKTFDVADIVSEAFARRVENPEDYKIIEANLDIFDVDFDKFDIDSINQARAMALKIAQKIGKQKFLRVFAPGMMGPGGLAGLNMIAEPTSIKLTESDYDGFKEGNARAGIFKNKPDLERNVLNDPSVPDSTEGIGKVSDTGRYDSRVHKKDWYKSKKWEALDGNRKKQLDYIEEIAESGDDNKRIFRETINGLAEDANKLKKIEKDFNSGKISKEEFDKQRKNLIILTPTEARWLVATASEDMTGAIKNSASLIGFPDLNRKDLAESLNLKPNDKYVLEHMTPAKYMALITYKYLLDPSAKNKSDFNTELDNFNTIILPEGVDTILRESGKQSSMGLQHKIGDNPFDTRYDEVLKIMKIVLRDGRVIGNTTSNFSKMNNNPKTKQANVDLVDKSQVVKASETNNNGITVIETEVLDKALSIARDPDAPVKKIRVFDFDDTLAESNSLVFYTMPDGTKGELTAEQFAERGSDLLIEGAEFNFDDFNIVRDGKPGPLLKVAKAIQNARGTEDVFVLTARAPESAQAIQSFLKSVGLEIPIENITGLGNSSGIAKSSWIVNKAAEGYNDFYFADDAPQNVKAVKNALDLMDVKSKTQLVKENTIKFSETGGKKLDWKTDEAGNINTTFNVGNKKYNFSLDSRDSKGSFDVDFNLGGRRDLTGTGNSVTVIKTVYNGLLNAIDQNKNIKRIEFSADQAEPSRVKLYTTLANRISKKLGWELDVYETKSFIGGVNSFDFELTKPSPIFRALDVVDIKSPVQQAKVRFSETVDQAMNDIIYQKTGIESFKEYSDVRAQAEGRGKRSFDLIPASAEDFGGLLYRMLGKGKIGDAQWEWMQDNLIKPYNRGVNDLVVAQNTLAADFRALKESLEGIPKNLKKKAFGGFTFEDVVRIHTWNKQGITIEGISKRDLKDVSEFVNQNPELDVFSDQLIAITKGDGYYYPGKNWLAGTITTDFREGLRTTSRAKYLAQWQANVDEAFSNKNLNKIEAAFGNKYREALEDSLQRMKTGTNRNQQMGRLESRFLDYINGSVGAVMFLNARSAVLQTISALNFVNWGDNNVFAAGKAFANQPQYWKDFMTLMNSDYLVDRRNGLKINVSENEIAEAAKTSKNKAKAVISTLLSKGFVLTQIADSFAIASGGATFYRNRIKKLMKEGMSESEATKQAFQDFKEVSETSQQSADPSKISQQQASTIGKIILAWGNTPMQYNRIIKKASLDLVNRRGDWKDNMSKIIYYGALQNIIFTTLQTGLFAVAFGEDEEDDAVMKDKTISTINSLMDNLLRGMGIGGAVVSTIKNLGIEIYDRSKRKKPDYADVALKLLDVAPPVDVKVSKFRQGLTTYEYSQKDPRREEFFNVDNPSYSAAAKVIAATTNVPVDRLLQKAQNLENAMDDQNQWWKRAAFFLGWPEWQLRSSKEATEFKELMKEKRKQYKEETTKRQAAFKVSQMSDKEKESYEREQDSISYVKLNKPEQVRKLDSLGLTKKEIRALKYEKDRVNKLLELMEK